MEYETSYFMDYKSRIKHNVTPAESGVFGKVLLTQDGLKYIKPFKLYLTFRSKSKSKPYSVLSYDKMVFTNDWLLETTRKEFDKNHKTKQC